MSEYENLVEIGRGSFAIVYKATRSSAASLALSAGDGIIKPGQTIAIKVVNKTKLSRKLAENLEMEILILKKARHRNVVALHKVLRSEKEISLVMEYCALGDLSLFIKRKGQVPGMNGMNQSLLISVSGPWGGLDQFVLRYLLAQLASAMEFLRFHHIIHRDLKPQNILLSLPPPPVPLSDEFHLKSLTEQKLSLLPLLKLADFGFARSLEAESMASTLCGSPLYMAPEILKGERYDAKTDLWSVGAILFEMISGKPPFRAQNHIELLRKIERGDGWIRFPDEGPDAFIDSFQARDVLGLPKRQTAGSLGHRASMAPTHYGASLGGGGGARIGMPSMGIPKTPIPDDLKSLVRRLLKRNPVERMSFEEFFISPAVVESLKMDPRLMESPSLTSFLEEDLGIKSVLSAISSASPSSSHRQADPSKSTSDSNIQQPESNPYTTTTSDSNIQTSESNPNTTTTASALPLDQLHIGPFNSNYDPLPLSAPFPSYGHDPNWSQKVLKKTSIIASPITSTTPQALKLASEIKFEMKEPPVLAPSVFKSAVTSRSSVKQMGSQSSLGSSVGSVEFSSDEDEEKVANIPPAHQLRNPEPPQPASQIPASRGEAESEDFVVVEKGTVDVKWNPYPEQAKSDPLPIPFTSSTAAPLSSSNSKVFAQAAVSSWSRPFQSISKAISSSLIYGTSPVSGKSGSPSSLEVKNIAHPKGRLFGSLRADNSFIAPNNHVQNHTTSTIPTLDPSLLTDALPFKLDLSNLSPSNRDAILKISIYVSRAFCISSLADQQWHDLESDNGSLLVGSTDSKTKQWNSLATDTLQLLLFSLGLYQYAMTHAKDLWKSGPAIIREGYTFSSSPPDTQQLYLSHLSTLINFIQVQFNSYFDRAERLQKSLGVLDVQMAKSPQRIIYETALSTCKRGALAELGGEGGQGFYKTAILLLQAVLQPSWEEAANVDGVGVGKLDDEDQKEIQALLDQILARLHRQG